jgi:Putative nuclear envelope organisation protein
MNQYYYDINDTVYSTWSESQLKQWLIQQNIIKSDAQIKKEKMIKLVQYALPLLHIIFET